MKENQTLTEFLEEYKEQEQQVHALDYANLSDADRQLLTEFSEKKAFLNEMQNALDFIQNSTAVIQREQDGKQVLSLESMLQLDKHDKDASMQEYAKDLVVLTNGLDSRTIEELQKGQNPFETAELNAQMKVVTNQPEMREAIDKELQERQREEITVKEVQEVQQRIEEEKRQLELQKEEQERQEAENKDDHTAERFERLAAAAALTVIAVKGAEELTRVAEELDKETKEKASPEVSVSAEIADDGHAIIKNIEGQNRQPADKDIDMSEVREKVAEKVNEKVAEVKETVDLHSREVAPKSDKAENERSNTEQGKNKPSKGKFDMDR